MHAMLIGILPTLRKSDLGLDSMVPSPRYHALNKAINELRGGAFELSIKGLDELHHQARLGDARGVQLQLPGPPAGGAVGVRAHVQPRPAAGRADGRHLGQLAAPVRAQAVGRDAHRAVPPGDRHAQPHPPPCARPRRGSASAPSGSRTRSSRSTRRTSRASAPWSAPTWTRTRWRCSSAARCRCSRRCACTTAPSTGGTGPATACSRASRTCASRTGSCRRGRPSSTRWPTARSGSA